MTLMQRMRTQGLLALLGLLLAPSAWADVVEYIHTDALGSPVAVTDQAAQVVERTTYEPYGNVIGRANNDRQGYTGHVMDSATGLTYMQQRYYDPTIGRFLSVDPVTAIDGGPDHFNRYDYAYNNPYKFTDPDGRCPMCVGFAVGAGLDLAIQVAEIAAGQRTDIDKTSILISGVSGAVGVGLAGKIASFGARMGTNALVSVATSKAKGEKPTIAGVLADTVAGEGAGHVAEKTILGSVESRVAQRQISRLERIGSKPGARTAQQVRANTARSLFKQEVAEKAAPIGTAASGVGSSLASQIQRATGKRDEQ